MWTSPDGVNWTRITVNGMDPPSRNVEVWAEARGMKATAVAPGGIVSVDESEECDVDGEPKLRAVVSTATTKH